MLDESYDGLDGCVVKALPSVKVMPWWTLIQRDGLKMLDFVCKENMSNSGIHIWLELSDEQMSKRLQFSLLNDEQMSNWVGVKHLPDIPR